MIDGIKVKLQADNNKFQERIVNSLDFIISESFKYSIDSPSVTGMKNNLRVTVNKDFAIICNSVSRAYFGDNQYRFDYKTLNQATNYFSEIFQTDFKEAKILSIDNYVDIVLKYPIINYLPCFSTIPYLGQFHIFNTTTYSQNKIRGAKAYGKNEESNTNNEYLIGNNILRFEIRHKKNPSNYLKLGKPLKWKHLITKFGVQRMNLLLIKMFDNTRLVNNNSGVKFSDCTNYSQFQKKVWEEWVELKGGSRKVYDIISEVRSFDNFNDRKGYTRLRKQIKEVSEQITCDIDLVGELRKAFFETIRYRN